jgi:hypothetical protein
MSAGSSMLAITLTFPQRPQRSTSIANIRFSRLERAEVGTRLVSGRPVSDKSLFSDCTRSDFAGRPRVGGRVRVEAIRQEFVATFPRKETIASLPGRRQYRDARAVCGAMA